MPVRLRKQNDVVEPLDNLAAIEILDTEGSLGMVIFVDRRNAVNITTTGDPLFTAYCRTHRMKAAKVHHHDKTSTHPA